MIHEFALDPRILNCWQTYSYFVHDCGAEHGRLISDFPNRWKKMVWEAVMRNPNRPPLDKQRVQFDLQHRVAAKLLPTNRRYDFNNPDWLQQAEREHERKPFRGIVSQANPRNKLAVILAGELDKEADPRWQVKRSANIQRTPEALAAVARPLLAISKRVRFVDSHFAPEAPRYRRSFKTMLAVLAECNPGITEAEVHLEARSTGQFFRDACRKELPRIMPTGMSLLLVRWKQRAGERELHRRCILTDRGGIAVDAGLDAGLEGERTDVELLTEELRTMHWRSCEKALKGPSGETLATVYDFVDEVQL